MAELIVSKLVSFGLLASASPTALAIANLGTSLLLSAAGAALSRPSGSDQSAEFSVPRSVPVNRAVYGMGVRMQGSGAPAMVVSGTGAAAVAYGCLILNSRPSDGRNFAMFLDRRAVGLSGDLRDFGTLAQGTATVAESATSVVVTHGLGAAPPAALVKAWGADGAPLAISAIGASTFTVTIPDPAPPGGFAVTWRAGRPTDGGVAQNLPFAGHVNVWLGTGAQSHPPLRILQEFGDLQAVDPSKFWPTDRWTGRTVLWFRFLKGSGTTRWPSVPPLVEVQCDWTPVWDPRDPDQDPDDPATWRVSDNQALCLLDALLHNPIEPYPLRQVMLDHFEAGADLADQRIRLRSGGSEKRYRVGGAVAYGEGVELADALRPLEVAGASSLVRVGGRIGLAPGGWEEPEVTLGEPLADAPLEFTSTRPTRGLPFAVKGLHPDPRANWERTETPARAVRADWDGGDSGVRGIDLGLVFSSSQAQRLNKIEAERLKLGKALSGVWPPTALEAVAGGRVSVALPGAGDPRSGIYRVTRSDPMRWTQTDEGVIGALPLDLQQDAAGVYAWDHLTDEVIPFDQGEPPADPTVPLPTELAGVLDGVDLDVTVKVPDVYTNPVDDEWVPLVNAVELQFRRNQEPFWLAAPAMAFAGGVGGIRITASATIGDVVSGSSYDLRVRGVIGARLGAWVLVYAVPVGITLGAPTGVTATAGAGQIEVSATAPADTDCAGVQIWAGLSADPEAAFLVDEIACAPSATVTATATGLPPALHRVFVRAVTASGAVGPWAATVTATPT